MYKTHARKHTHTESLRQTQTQISTMSSTTTIRLSPEAYSSVCRILSDGDDVFENQCEQLIAEKKFDKYADSMMQKLSGVMDSNKKKIRGTYSFYYVYINKYKYFFVHICMHYANYNYKFIHLFHFSFAMYACVWCVCVHNKLHFFRTHHSYIAAVESFVLVLCGAILEGGRAAEQMKQLAALITSTATTGSALRVYVCVYV